MDRFVPALPDVLIRIVPYLDYKPLSALLQLRLSTVRVFIRYVARAYFTYILTTFLSKVHRL